MLVLLVLKVLVLEPMKPILRTPILKFSGCFALLPRGDGGTLH